MNPENNPEVQTSAPEQIPVAPPVSAPSETTISEPIKDKRRHFLAVFFFSFLFGVFGVDRFYMGKFWTGLLKLLTFGGFGIWAMIDLAMVMSGSMRDRQGNEMIDHQRYKKFAKRTVWIFTLLVFIVVIIIGGLSVYFAIQFFQNGGLNELLKFIPGFDKLQALQGTTEQKTPSLQEIQAILSGLNNK